MGEIAEKIWDVGHYDWTGKKGHLGVWATLKKFRTTHGKELSRSERLV